MAGTINKVILVGNLGRDPEIRHSQDGARIVSFSIATSESWTDRATGERKDRTEWHRIVVFNDRLGEICERYLKKGSKVYIEGQLQTRKWTDNSGQEKYTTEVVLSKFKGELTLLDSRPSSDYSDQDVPRSTGSSENFEFSQKSRPAVSAEPLADFDDDIPF